MRAALKLVGSRLFKRRILPKRVTSGLHLEPLEHRQLLAVGPQVTGVEVYSSAWSPAFLQYQKAATGGAFGYRIADGSAEQLRTLSWSSLDTITLKFSDSVNVASTDLVLRGTKVAEHKIHSFSYDATSHSATWKFSESFVNDKYLIDLSSSITDQALRHLDGEWKDASDVFPSGNSDAGGDFLMRFNVLPGDADRNGAVLGANDIRDFAILRSNFNSKMVGQAADFTGNGRVDITDFGVLRLGFNSRLPNIEPSTAPVVLTETSPSSGEGLVSLTRESIVRFDTPVDPNTVDANGVYAIANGGKLAGHIVVSATEKFATLYFENPLPAATEVRLVVDGSQIVGRDGLMLDADGDGVPGGVSTADFTTLPNTFIPGTSVFGRIYDSYNRVGDQNIPVVGATIFLDSNPEIKAVTDANGFFELTSPDGLPAPEFFVHIDGSTATNAPAGTKYATLGKPFHSVPGQRVQISLDGTPFDIFLPPMAAADIVTLSTTQETEVGFGPAGQEQIRKLFREKYPADLARADREAQLTIDTFTVTYPAGSAQDQDGAAATLGTVIPVDPNRLPAPLPAGVSPAVVFSVQAGTAAGFNLAGGSTAFSTPAPLSYPNVYGLAPGEVRFIYSFDHDAGKWAIVGTATVSADGRTIDSDPGVGIRAPGWGFVPPEPQDDPDPCIPDIKNVDTIKDFTQVIRTCAEALLGGEVRKWLSTAETLISQAASLYSSISDLKDKLEKGESAAAVAASYNALNAVKGAFVAAYDLWKGQSPLSKINGAIQCLNAVLSAAESICNRIRAEKSGECDTIRMRLLCLGLGTARGLIATAATLSLRVENAQGRIGTAVICELMNIVGSILSSGPPSLSQGSGSVPFAGEQNVLDVLQMLLDETSEVRNAAQMIGDLDVALHNADQATTTSVRDAQSLYEDVYSSLGAFYLIQFSGSSVEIRGKTDGSGDFEGTLPANTGFRYLLFDPIRNRIATLESISGPAGSSSPIPLPSFVDAGGLPDEDLDGLVDLAEEVIGTNPNRRDTDLDGINDFTEIQQGLDPFGGKAFPTGVISSLPLLGEARELVVEGSSLDASRQTAYMATGSQGLAIVNTSQFNNPIILGQLDLPGDSSDIAVDSERQLAYLAAGGDGVHVVNVSDSMAPVLERSISVPSGASHVVLFDGLLYVASSQTDRISVIDPLTGEILQRVGVGSSVKDLSRDGTTLYVATGANQLKTFDISGFEMVSLGSVDVPSTAHKLFVSSGVAYVSNGGNGYSTINVANPANMLVISGPDTPAVQASNQMTVVNGSGLAIVAAGNRGIELHSASDPEVTYGFLSKFDTSGFSQSVVLAGGLAFVADGISGLQVVNYISFDNKGVSPSVSASSSNVDADPAKAGRQIIEGSSLRVSAKLGDDVQVRNVELLLNGQVVANRVSAPYDFSVAVPPLTGSPNLSVELRATDTGGNSKLSAPLTFEIVDDKFSPVLLGTTPSDDSKVFYTPSIDVRFNEPIDAELVSESDVSILFLGGDGAAGGGDDRVIVVRETNVRSSGRKLVIVPDEFLETGKYQVKIDAAGIGDRAGNVRTQDIEFDFTIRPASNIIAESGFATVTRAPSANPGQVVALRIGGISFESAVNFNVMDSAGNLGQVSVNPIAVNSEEQLGYYAVPVNAVTGDITLPGTNPDTFPLQIVPLLTSGDVYSLADNTTGALNVLLRGVGFVEGNESSYAFGGVVVNDANTFDGPDVRYVFAQENDGVYLTVPGGNWNGPISVTTAGGTSAPLTLDFTKIASTALSGTPADSQKASANPGQMITVQGSGLDQSSDFLFRYTANDGNVYWELRNPNFANAQGTEATLELPNYYNGAFSVRRLGSGQEQVLQIVPRVDSIEVNGANSAMVRGQGFQEGNNSVYQFAGGQVVDADAGSGPDVSYRFVHENDSVSLSLPTHGLGNFTVTTAGGTSAPFAANFLNPGLGDLRDLAFDGTNFWAAAYNGQLAKISRTTGQTLASFPLPLNQASSGLGLQVVPAGLTLGGVAIPAGSLLVSDWNGAPDRIDALNPTTGAILSTVVLQEDLDPVAVLFDPAAGGHLYVLDSSPTRLVEINPASGAVVRSIDLSAVIQLNGGTGGLAKHPTSGNYYVTGYVAGKIVEIRPDGTLVRTIDLAAQGLASTLTGLAFDNAGNLFASTYWGNIYRVALSSTPQPAPSLTAIVGSALNGTPKIGAQASANAAQVIELVGTNLTMATRVKFPIRNENGQAGEVVVNPRAVNAAGTRLQVVVPDLASTGNVSLVGGTGSVRLQIVPVIRSTSGQPGVDGYFDLFGSGFQEGAGKITVGGVVLDDVYTNDLYYSLLDADVTGVRNDAYRLLFPFAVEGSVSVETEGGTASFTLPTPGRPAFVEFTGLEGVNAQFGRPASNTALSANAGQTITLIGRGFHAGTLVQFEGVDAAGAVGKLTRTGTPSLNGARLTLSVPALARSGKVRVVGSSTEVTLQVVPTIRSLGGPLTAGSPAILEGTGLVPGELTLTVDGQAVASPQVETIFSQGIGQQVVRFTVPAGVTQGQVQVGTLGGQAHFRRGFNPASLADVNTLEFFGGAGDRVNDTLSTALAVTLPVDRKVNVNAWLNQSNDVDLYRLTLVRGELLRVEAQGVGAGVGSLNNGYLRVFDATGVELLASDAGGLGNDALLSFLASKDGTYYVGVSGWANTGYNPNTASSGTSGDTGSYRLVLERSLQGTTVLTGMTAALGSGTRAIAGVAAANAGQTITLTGTGFRSNDQLVFTTVDRNGVLGFPIITPSSVAPDGTSLQVTVPYAAASGMVRLLRENAGLFLQVVPTLVDADQGQNEPFHNGGLVLQGSGFIESAATVRFGGQSLIDRSTSPYPLDVSGVFAFENDYLGLTVPSGVPFGPIVVSTLGGSSASFSLTATGVTATATSGSPKNAGQASANPGQSITLQGTGFDASTDVVFEVIDSSGNRYERVVRPIAVAPSGASLEVLVPIDAITGVVGVVGDRNNSRFPLQIVPLLTSGDVYSLADNTTGALNVLLRGVGFVEGNESSYAFGGVVVNDANTFDGPDVRYVFAQENDGVYLTVPGGNWNGPISVTTAGGTSAPLTLDFTKIASTALSGTPADSQKASANPGQMITVQGSGLDQSSDFLFRYTANDGNVYWELRNPNFANAQGTEATLELPNYYNGAFSVRRLGSGQEQVLQIVPRVDSIEVNGANSAMVRGQGFQEGNNSVYQFAGGQVVDADAGSGPDVSYRFVHENDSVSLSLPTHGLGNFTVTTAGGTSAPFAANFLNPGLGDLRDLAFDGTNFWAAAYNGQLAKISRTTGQTLASFPLPLNQASSGLGLQVVPAGLTLGGVAIPAGSLLVSDWNGAPDRIDALNPTTGAILSTVVLQEDLDPVAVLFDPAAGGHLYVLDSSPTRLVEINPASGAVVRSIDLSAVIQLNGGTGGLAKHPTSGNYYVTGYVAGKIVEIRPDGTLVRTIDLAAQGLASTLTGLAFDNAGNLFASTYWGNIYRIAI